MYQLISALSLVMVLGQAATCEAASGTGSTEMKSSDKSQSLIGKARRDGSVRLVVSLKADFVPEGKLPDGGAAQRKTIADLQIAVLARLEGCKVESVWRFEHTPTLSLQADECAVMRLMEAPEVSSVTEDVPVPPARSSRH